MHRYRIPVYICTNRVVFTCTYVQHPPTHTALTLTELTVPRVVVGLVRHLMVQHRVPGPAPQQVREGQRLQDDYQLQQRAMKELVHKDRHTSPSESKKAIRITTGMDLCSY